MDSTISCLFDFFFFFLSDPAGSTIGWLLAATFTRLVLVIFTFGVRVPAGIFIPALAIGASWGRAVGVFVQYFER